MSQKKLIDTDLLGRFKTNMDGITGDKDDLETTNKSSLVAAINEVNGNAGTNVKASIADDFSTSVNYAVGDYCYHLGSLYECTTAHSGAWDATHFTATTATGELKEKQDKTDNALTTTNKTVTGAINELKNTITKQTYSITNQSQYISLLRYIQGNIDFTKLTDTSYIKVSYSGSDRTDIYKLTRNGEKVAFSFMNGGSNVLRVWEASIFNNSNDPTLYLYEILGSGNSITDVTNSDCTGQTWTLYY